MENPNLTNRSNTKTEETGDKKDVFKIKVKEYEEFPNLMGCGFVTCNQIAAKIGTLLGNAYKDYFGCKIIPYANGAGFSVELYFAHSQNMGTKGEAFAFTTDMDNSSNKTGSSIVNALNAVASRPKAKLYNHTKELEEGLEKFFPGPAKKQINWGNVIGEVTETNGAYQCTYAVVSGLDLYKFIQAIYGAKDENGKYYSYDLSVKRAVGTDTLLMMNRISETTINDLLKSMGVINTPGFGIIRP